MNSSSTLTLLALLGLAACGGSDPPAAKVNPYLGTLTISSAAATNTCLALTPVIFTATGVSPSTVTIAGGGCLVFTNNDAAAHQPASIGAPACPQLDGPVLTRLGTFTTTPFTAATTCRWQDLLNPPGGGGGGGY